jgi:hypothetical protein
VPVFTTLYEVLDPDGTTVLLSTAGTQTSSGYETITWKRPGRPKRRLVEQGAYVAGEVETVSVLDVDRLQWHVRVVGSSYADLESKYNALVAACEAGVPGDDRRQRADVDGDGGPEHHGPGGGPGRGRPAVEPAGGVGRGLARHPHLTNPPISCQLK